MLTVDPSYQSSPLSGDIPTMQLLTGGSPLSRNALLRHDLLHTMFEKGPAHSTHCSTKGTRHLVPRPTRRLLLHTPTLGTINTSRWTHYQSHSTRLPTRTLPIPARDAGETSDHTQLSAGTPPYPEYFLRHTLVYWKPPPPHTAALPGRSLLHTRLNSRRFLIRHTPPGTLPP